MDSKPSIFDSKYRNMNQEETMLNYDRDTMLWEQTKALEKSNAIMEQNIRNQEESKKMYEQIVGKIENSYEDVSELICKNQTKLEENQHSHDELMRFYKLCDDMGLNYDEIKKFDYWLRNPTNEQWGKYFDINMKYKEIFETDEIKHLYTVKDEKSKEYTKVKEIVDENIEKIKSVFYKSPDDLYWEDYISISGIDNFRGGSDVEVENLININISNIKNLKILLFFMMCVTIPLCLTGVFIFSLFIFIFLGLFILNRIVRLNNGKIILEKALKEYQTKKQEEEDKMNDMAIKCDNLNMEIEKLEKQISNAENAREEELKTNRKYIAIKKEKEMLDKDFWNKECTINQKEFDEFRKNHFNDDVERLLRKLELKNIKLIKTVDVINNGTIEDYRKFIEDKVLNINDLYFEDYETYYMDGVVKRILNGTNK